MVRIVFIFVLFFYSFTSFSNELSTQEKKIFNFIDLDKNKKISIEEINKLIKLIFQLIDENQDGNVSEKEIIELKSIIESMS